MVALMLAGAFAVILGGCSYGALVALNQTVSAECPCPEATP